MGGNTIEGSALFTVRSEPMTVEGLLFSKNGGGASITLGYRTKDDSTTSYVAAEHMVNKPGGGSGTDLKAGIFYRYKYLSCGASVTSPLDLTLNAASQRGGLQALRQRVDGNVWAMFKQGTVALGTACQLVDGRPDALNGVICYRNQWTRPDEPCTELTIRTTQKIADGQSAPTFHGSYYQRMVTRRKVQNPFEEANVQFITNYVDLGVETTVAATGTKMAVGAAWQVNKNTLVKGKIGNSAFSFLVAAKSWWDPSATVALTVSKPFDGASRGTRIGLAFSIENWGGIGYHRPSDTYKRYVPMQMDRVSDETEPDTAEALLRRQKTAAN